MRILIGIFVTLIAIGLIHRDKGKWYEYLAAIVIGLLATVGLLFI